MSWAFGSAKPSAPWAKDCRAPTLVEALVSLDAGESVAIFSSAFTSLDDKKVAAECGTGVFVAKSDLSDGGSEANIWISDTGDL
ncbi:hypothetical protein GCM10007922_24180 [Shewanella decolorationis]|nr:hypothetical protein GCM10007922_24180 [Shewanella decolorationis]